MSFTQEQFERLSSLMSDKGVVHGAFELLADLRHSEVLAKQEANAITNSVVVALAGLTDFEGLPVSELNYLQVIRKLKTKIESHLTWHDEAPKNDGRYICSIGEDKYPVICAKKFENGRWLLGEREKIRWAYLPTLEEVTDEN